MSTIVTRSGKGSPLTHTEVDDNFTNLNTGKYQEGSAIGAVTPAAGTFTTLTATGQTSLGGAAGSESLRATVVASSVNWLQVQGSTSTNRPRLVAQGSDGDIGLNYITKGSGTHSFASDANAGTVQFSIIRTASAVNYVQVTGAATGGRVTISSQGSDTNVPMIIGTKGSGSLNVRTDGSASTQFAVTHTSSAANYINVTGGAATNSPVISALGTDTNIDLTLTPKGTGNVRFGTYTGTALAIAGYIEIKDAGGTLRKLAVVA